MFQCDRHTAGRKRFRHFAPIRRQSVTGPPARTSLRKPHARFQCSEGRSLARPTSRVNNSTVTARGGPVPRWEHARSDSRVNSSAAVAHEKLIPRRPLTRSKCSAVAHAWHNALPATYRETFAEDCIVSANKAIVSLIAERRGHVGLQKSFPPAYTRWRKGDRQRSDIAVRRSPTAKSGIRPHMPRVRVETAAED